MNFRTCNALISFWLHFFFHWPLTVTEERYPIANGFLAYKTVTSIRPSCTCPTSYACSCCQIVTILFIKAEKNLCVNFVYQGNGVRIDVTLNSDVLKSRKVTDYSPLKFCIDIPRCVFSTACINVLELNQFSRSITVCLRLDIYSKKRIWQLNYDCVSISTVPEAMTAGTTKMMSNSTTKMMAATTTKMTGSATTATTKIMAATTTTMKPGMSAMSSSQMTMTTMTTTAMTTTTMSTMVPRRAETEETTPDVELITEPGSETTIIDID
ncbi:uncharacterized protein LOC143353019 [Halictus rubicundus]|uniref:uncharacterized protein LOC143353019 n=1 Tax=Halictus rubicundus TaxID=77578 RepID=UPI004036685E